MKAKTTIPSLGALAIVTLFSTSPAQACMGGGMPFFSGGPGQASCATSQAQPVPRSAPQLALQPQPAPRSCAQRGQSADAGQSCGLVNPELMAAMGDMAAGGMQIATHMMKVLAEEVSRYAAVGDGVK